MGKDNVQASQDYIIDITPNEPVIENESTVKVPRWEHQRIYSYYEILGATYEQKNFYYLFRRKFLNGKYLDLQGNTNYAFVLMLICWIPAKTYRNWKNRFNCLDSIIRKQNPMRTVF